MSFPKRKTLADAAVTILVAAMVVLVYAFLSRPPPSAPGGEIDALLDQRIDLAHFERVDLGDAVKFVADQTGLEIEVDWEGLRTSKALMNRPITILWQRDWPAWRVLGELVLQVEMRPLEWRVEGRHVVIGPAGAIPAPLGLRVYDVTDLVDEAVDRRIEIEHKLQPNQPGGNRSAFETEALNDLRLLAILELEVLPTIPSRMRIPAPGMIQAGARQLVTLLAAEHHRRIEDLLELLRSR